MKPYISIRYECGNRTYTLPVNAKYRELADCAAALGLKDGDNERDVRAERYLSLYSPVSTSADAWPLVRETDRRLGGLSPAQAEAVYTLCRVFGLRFAGVLAVIRHTEMLKGAQDYEQE